MIITKKVAGQVDLNDGEFAEVQTIRAEGIEKDLLLDTFQIHREDTDDTPDQFRRRFSIGTRLDIVATTTISPSSEVGQKGTVDARLNKQHDQANYGSRRCKKGRRMQTRH